MLQVENLNVFYGMIHALKDVSFSVEEGTIVSLIGSNGSGKTSTLHAISSLIPIKSGRITFSNESLDSTSPDIIVKKGLIQVPEGRRIFANMSVYENLEMGAYTRSNHKEMLCDIEKGFARFPRLKERKKQIAGTLSGGEQQMLAMARALMAHPKLLLLDEPSMGLAPLLVDEIFSIIKDISKAGVTILLVEQNAFKALKLADKAYVLETGKITLSGTGKELLTNPEIQKAYLGA